MTTARQWLTLTMAFVLFATAPMLHARTRQPAPCAPRITDGWIRLMPGGMPMQAGFARIANPCPHAVEITAVRSPLHGDASLHESTQVDGVSRMREVPVLGVPARGTIELKPGGLHLMLMKPRRELHAGETVRLQLTLRDGRVLSAPFVVRPLVP